MRYQYVVILKKDSQRITDVLSVLLCMVSVIGFSLNAFKANHYIQAILSISLALFLLIGIPIRLLMHRRSGAPVRYRYWLLLAAVGWLGLTTVPWIGAFFFLLAFLEYQTKRPLEIGFHHDRVVINTLIKQRFDWSAFNNVILRDGILTLDFSNNRLMQKEVADDEDEDDADEEEFNAFCRSMLKENR
ncbi:MAG TPA: hypothetical protein VNU70_05485 [Puia sp.]|jgi:hypothetical protein|nr:hypothetical protein [Puia sp.]